MLGDIKKRLEASLELDVINGEPFEKAILSGQIEEAIKYINRLEKLIDSFPLVVYEELLSDCGEVMAKAAAHAVKSLIREV